VAAPRSALPSAAELERAARILAVRSRREVSSAFAGGYRSAFRGGGVEFEESRPYVPGDDVRHLDWNALARTGSPYVKRFRGAYLFLLNAWYFDALYDALFVRPAMRLGRFLWRTGDGAIIDGIGPDGVSARVIDIANRAIKLQSGYIYHYAFAMLIGVAALITWFMFAVH
jgi:hypothetical protein